MTWIVTSTTEGSRALWSTTNCIKRQRCLKINKLIRKQGCPRTCHHCRHSGQSIWKVLTRKAWMQQGSSWRTRRFEEALWARRVKRRNWRWMIYHPMCLCWSHKIFPIRRQPKCQQHQRKCCKHATTTASKVFGWFTHSIWFSARLVWLAWGTSNYRGLIRRCIRCTTSVNP